MARPNVLFILIDDLGWRDLSCTGSEFYETPNIDRLAAAGMTFTNAYASCPVCSPTRASIMTGKYPARIPITNHIPGRPRGLLLSPDYLNHLPLSETTLASALKEHDYQTWHVGKWHLGGPQAYPEKHGFDVNVGGCSWGMPKMGYFSPWGIETLPDSQPGEYLTDRLTDDALQLLQNRDRERPFFLNLWYYSVHIPIQAKPEIIQKYEEKAKRLGLDQEDPFEIGENFPCEHKRDKHVIRRLFQSDPVYAAMIETLDTNIGRVLDWLEEHGLADDTLVVFTSDNGGLSSSEGSPTCNAPLAEGKGWLYEGGVREPLLVRWPGQIAAGSTCAEPVTSPDFYPTILEALGLPLLPKQHVDGVSFLPALRGEPFTRGPVYWHYPHYSNQGGTPGCAIRNGQWKLIQFFEYGNRELFDLEKEPEEDRNLAQRLPEKTEELATQLADWLRDVDARIPPPNPDWEE
jgi:arylsulfatase A-like enzyme